MLVQCRAAGHEGHPAGRAGEGDRHELGEAAGVVLDRAEHPQVRDASVVLLQSGGDDLGGTLLDGRVKPEAGIEHGLELPVTDAAAMVARMFRPFRLRTTVYGAVRQAPGSSG